MAVEIEVEFGVINIAAQPHPRGGYSSLLNRVSRIPKQFWGEEYGAITSPEYLEPGLFLGTIHVWSEFDPGKPAVDKETLEEVRVEDTEINVPANFGLNGKHFFYILRERDHRIFFESKNDEGAHLHPVRFKKILDRLFAPMNLGGGMRVEITVQPDEDGLEKVLSIPRITKLEILITPPNPDDNEDRAARVLRRLSEQGAKSQQIKYVAKSRKTGIKPNEDTLAEADVASANGLVKATGYDRNGDKLVRSTEEYPKIVRYIIEGAGSAIAGLIRIARTTKIRSRKVRGRG